MSGLALVLLGIAIGILLDGLIFDMDRPPEPTGQAVRSSE